MKLKTPLKALSLLALSTQLSTAAITFQTPTTISGDSDVSTNGTLVYAYNLGNAADVAVNSVLFQGGITGNAGAPGNADITTGFFNGGTAFGNAGLNTGDIGNLINGGIFQTGATGTTFPNTVTTTLNGLTAGTQYEVQLFVNDPRGPREDNDAVQFSSPGGSSVDLLLTSQEAGSPPGQFVIGTFTATGTTQDIFSTGFEDILADDGAGAGQSNGRTQINGIQLRVIPEPSSTLLLGMAGSVLLLRRRRS